MPTNVFIHESSYVDEGAVLGEGTRVWHFSHIMAGAILGRGCNLGQNVFVAGGVRIGDNAKIQNNVSIYDGVVLGDDVFCGPSMVFTNVMNPRAHLSRRDEYRETRVGRGATFGANSTVVCGYEIGEYAFIAAGAVVTSDVAAYALMAGVPARRIGWMCACGVKLPTGDADTREAACASCGAGYRIDEEAAVALPGSEG